MKVYVFEARKPTSRQEARGILESGVMDGIMGRQWISAAWERGLPAKEDSLLICGSFRNRTEPTLELPGLLTRLGICWHNHNRIRGRRNLSRAWLGKSQYPLSRVLDVHPLLFTKDLSYAF